MIFETVVTMAKILDLILVIPKPQENTFLPRSIQILGIVTAPEGTEANTGHNLSCCWQLVCLGAAAISWAQLVGELWRARPCV